MSDLGLLIGRLAVAPMFLVAGWAKLTSFPPAFVVNQVERAGLPFPTAVAGGVTALELVAPVLLVLGVLTRWSAAALALFTIAATWMAHRWWLYPEAQQGLQQILALKNVAVCGLLLLIMIAGSGRYALRRD
jgi:putative oxidoreductase